MRRKINTADCVQKLNPHTYLSPIACVMCWPNEETDNLLINHCPIVASLLVKLLKVATVEWVFQ